MTLVSGRGRAAERYAGLNDDDERGRSYRDVVGRCRLTVSKPVLKSPTVSALEATIS